MVQHDGVQKYEKRNSKKLLQKIISVHEMKLAYI